jgi:hypothetical protein
MFSAGCTYRVHLEAVVRVSGHRPPGRAMQENNIEQGNCEAFVIRVASIDRRKKGALR